MALSVPLLCPVCSEALLPAERSYACLNRHNFDLSREGYLSLLHGQGNYEKIGDDKQMIQARVRVHGLSAYKELASVIAGYRPQADTSQAVLDIGCGDGFFLGEVAKASASPGTAVGIDISRSALARAARSLPGHFFVRTDAAHNRLPFADASFGLVLSIFAPRPLDEIRRVLRPDGKWIVVTATQDHLKEAREFVPLASIGTGKLDEASASFSVVRERTFVREEEVAHADLVSVVEMSPSIHRLRRDFGEKWSERVPQRLQVTFSFSITLMERSPGTRPDPEGKGPSV